VSLQLRGHELLESGRSGQAAALLTRAVAATGERLSSCLEPVSEACLTFAYALYDLGRAVALDGRPAEAVSILERRLEIDNQRAVVATALQRARAQAG
jgi:tetratricopeptide (TPR) repeat protein